ncbi:MULTISPECIES: hypothetical protein [unclassified Amycolatopsis]|uniref:hypothetical protein n=1 Tax=unclassified Amycolatopsis TaxID=2618356 RepID=UPI001A8DCE7C|nr:MULTISPECIES: hypothetical protein [unclassified Amycolatopsis]HET6704095.1 hypothetical protein [Amycolatopsis sp.]
MTEEGTDHVHVEVHEPAETWDDLAIEGVVAVYRNTKTGSYRTAVVYGFTADRCALVLDTDLGHGLTTVHQAAHEDERSVRLHLIASPTTPDPVR